MVEISFTPENLSIGVEAGTTILEAARLVGLAVEAPCNGIGNCGKCKMKLINQDTATIVVRKGKHQLHRSRQRQGFVLACQTEAWSDLRVEADFAGSDAAGGILSRGKNLAIERVPFVTKTYVGNEEGTAVYAGKVQLGFEKGNTEEKNYGVVIDIGTTTLVASLVDINTGRELSSVSSLNPQARHAQDVLSRIKLASDPDGLSLMYSAITGEIKRLIIQLAAGARIDPAHIYETVYSGNTCMLHLAANIDPRSLGKYPYQPVIAGGNNVKATEHQLGISEFGIIYLPPIVSAYVGADITSGILASRLHMRKGATLFVDIGTNGEMVLAVNGRMSSTSTAAGPAFEGMNIACGMRAGTGAVERFEINCTGEVLLEIIGGGRPRGICGSGLIDIVAELVKNGIIDSQGRLQSADKPGLPPRLRERLQHREGKAVFAISDEVYITQKDIRQVQLAKGAVRAGIEYLLASQEINAGKVDKVLIAGSFGYHVRVESLVNIGLLPAEFANKIEVIGNTSQSGGRAFLLNGGYRREMKETVRQVSVIELAKHHDFEKVFVRCLQFGK